MKLSELNTGESGVIVKVSGHGGFRKRIIEMGFIKGKKVDVLLNAPLQDPVKYKIMGYEVSLRHSEADHIEVVSVNEAKKDKQLKHADEEEREQVINSQAVDSEDSDEQALGDKMLVAEQEADRLHHVINVALIGNPNCGKTSLFNFASGAHERVGNYSGVTVDAKVGEAEYNGYHFNLVDLLGTYSLSAYSPEELYVRKQLIEHTPDIVINVIDTSNPERNLYLTTQLIDMHIRMVCALNMFDETEKRGDNIDYDKLGELFGIPMVPTVFKNGRGVDQLFDTIIEMYEGREGSNAHYRHIHINHGHEIEHGIEHIQEYLKADDSIRQRLLHPISLHQTTRERQACRGICEPPQVGKGNLRRTRRGCTTRQGGNHGRQRDCHHGRQVRLHTRSLAGGWLRNGKGQRHLSGDASHRPHPYQQIRGIPHLRTPPVHHVLCHLRPGRGA